MKTKHLIACGFLGAFIAILTSQLAACATTDRWLQKGGSQTGPVDTLLTTSQIAQVVTALVPMIVKQAEGTNPPVVAAVPISTTNWIHVTNTVLYTNWAPNAYVKGVMEAGSMAAQSSGIPWLPWATGAVTTLVAAAFNEMNRRKKNEMTGATTTLISNVEDVKAIAAQLAHTLVASGVIKNPDYVAMIDRHVDAVLEQKQKDDDTHATILPIVKAQTVSNPISEHSDPVQMAIDATAPRG